MMDPFEAACHRLWADMARWFLTMHLLAVYEFEHSDPEVAGFAAGVVFEVCVQRMSSARVNGSIPGVL